MRNTLKTLLISVTITALTLFAGCAKEAEEKKQEAPKAAAETPAAQPKEDGLEKDCKKAFNNMVSIMEKEGTPKEIIEQMKKTADKNVKQCVTETNNIPDGPAALKCMTDAKSNEDIIACVKKHPRTKEAPAEKAPTAEGEKKPAAEGDKKAAAAKDDKPAAAEGEAKPKAADGDKPAAAEGEAKPKAAEGEAKPKATEGEAKPKATEGEAKPKAAETK